MMRAASTWTHALARPVCLVLALAACGGPSLKGPVGVSSSPPPTRSASTPVAAQNEPVDQRAARLHRNAIIVDGHNDIPTVIFGSAVDIGQPLARAHTDIPRLKAGGLTGSFFSIYVDDELAEKPTALGGGALRRALDLIDVTYRQIEKHPNDLVLAKSAEDIRRAKRANKVAVLMGVEGGHAIENSLFALRSLYRLGVRYMTLTHTHTHDWADSAGFSGPPVAKNKGLSPFGERVVKEMQRIGMLVDVSHVSDDTFWAVIKSARAPVIASHSSARALADHRRNLTDDMLKALAQNGGVAMVNFWSLFLSNEFGTAQRAFWEKNQKVLTELRAKHKGNPLAYRKALEKLHADSEPLPKVPLSTLVDHIDHIVKVAGVDHVGLGSDFDGVDSLPDGIEGVDSLPKITVELVKRGYSDADILKILGGNFLRVFEKAETFAASTRTAISADGDLTKIEGGE